MAYTEFSTQNADYILQLGCHVGKNTHNVFHDTDAIIIETSGESITCFSKEDPQYEIIFDHVKSKKVPLFSTDIDIVKLAYARDLISESIFWISTVFLAPLIELSIFAYHGASKAKAKEPLRRFISSLEYLQQNPVVEGRNASNARNIEEFIAPLLTNRLKRKPKIALVYGAGHTGIQEDIQPKKRRDFTLHNWRDLNFGRWSGFNIEKLNRVEEVNYRCGCWCTKAYQTGLFS